MRVHARSAYLVCAIVAAACLQGCAPTGTDSVKNRVVVPHYDIRINPAAPNTARVSLTLPPVDPLDPTIPKLVSRGERLGIKPQIHDVRCNGMPLAQSGKGEWTLPPKCKTAHWTVDIRDVPPDGINVAKQQSLHLKTPKDWWLISGPSSLLRLVPPPPHTDVVIAVRGRPLVLDHLPGITLPPAFFVVGDAPSHRTTTDNLSLTYVADDLARVETTVRVEDHIRGIAYFRRILRSDEHADIPTDLTVVWLGVDRKKGDVGGAGGFDTLLANYIRSDAPPRKRGLILPLIIVLHEQFHQLTRGPLPAWMNESLATYFALKAVAQIYTDPADIAAARTTFLHPKAKIDLGLIDVQHELEQEHDFSHYSLFYSQGATFWDQIDKALAKATKGAKSLDDVLPAIMSTSYSGDAVLPPHVEDALADIPKDELNALVAKYLAARKR